MYDQQQVAYNSAQALPEATVLDNGISTLFNYINGQESLITSIEQKLHKILNRNTPATISDQKPEQRKPEDFVQRLTFETERIYSNNARLERIVKHLSEII